MEENFNPQQFRKRLYQRFDRDEPLKPGEPFYEPIYQQAGVEDPVALMFDTITMSSTESMQCFSGFRGSGKSTELLRLKGDLEAQGYVVLYADALEYLNPAQEVDIVSLLLVLAGAFSDALENAGFVSIAADNYWDRFVNFLKKTDVDVKELGLKAGTGSLGADLKLNLATTPTLRQKIKDQLENHVGALKRDVDKFFELGVKVIEAQRGGKLEGVVFLFDQLEQIRGSLSNEQTVIHSVEVLFAQHFQKLEMPYLHMVYTVPPWLKFVHPGGLRIELLPSIRQWNKDDARTEYPKGWKSLRSIVRRRFDDQEFAIFFGTPDDDNPSLNRLVAVCGGHFRDLLLLLRETVLRAKTFPVSDEVISAAISAVRSNFLPIAIDDAKWLDHIGRVRDSGLRSVAAADAGRLARFLDTHVVLFFCNGDEWYDIHPLIRDDVAQIVAREAALKAVQGTA